MRLIFDARYIRTDYHDGISRFTTELANAVSRALRPGDSVTYLISDLAQRDYLPHRAASILFHKPTSLLEPLASVLVARHHPDVVFSPLQSFGTLGNRVRLILTIHDLIYYRHRTPPSQFSWFVRLMWRLFYLSYWPQRFALNGADLVATVSDTTESDLRATRLTKRPIIVIPNAPRDLAALTGLTPSYATDRVQNLVYMGSFMGYKNVETLIRSMEHLHGRTLHLLSRIDDRRRAELEALIPPDAHVVFHNGVSDERYAELLADNAVLVTASEDEGYGLPVAEALAMGVPAVVSDLPIFREVAGDGALYCLTDSPASFAAAVTSLDDSGLRDRTIAEGRAHIQRFSWSASAEELLRSARHLAASD